MSKIKNLYTGQLSFHFNSNNNETKSLCIKNDEYENSGISKVVALDNRKEIYQKILNRIAKK